MKKKYLIKASTYAEIKIKEMIERGEYNQLFMDRIDWAYFSEIREKLAKIIIDK